MRAVAAGKRYVPSEIAQRMAEDRTRSALTHRELEILTFVYRGLTNPQIARELSLSEGTVRIHVSNILVKLEVKRRTEAVAVALKRGLIRPEP